MCSAMIPSRLVDSLDCSSPASRLYPNYAQSLVCDIVFSVPKWVVLVSWPWRIATSLRNFVTRTDDILVFLKTLLQGIDNNY
jgi:hypothetical protein